MKRILLVILLFLALVGAADAGYLLIQTVSGQPVVCPSVPIGRFNLNQCNIVLATSYAKFLGLPTALYGLVAYLLFAILILYELNQVVYYKSYSIQNKQNARNKRSAIKLLSILSGAGVLISAYFVYLQFFIIEAICFYCLLSASIMTLIFIGSAAYNFYNLKYSTGT